MSLELQGLTPDNLEYIKHTTFSYIPQVLLGPKAKAQKTREEQKAQKLAKAASNCPKISSFFGKKS